VREGLNFVFFVEVTLQDFRSFSFCDQRAVALVVVVRAQGRQFGGCCLELANLDKTVSAFCFMLQLYEL